MNRTRLLISGLTLAAVAAGVSACTPSNAAAGGAGGKPSPSTATATPTATGTATGSGTNSGLGSGASAGGAGSTTGPGAYILGSMPVGTVSLQRVAHDHLQAHVVMYGLTPGSAHDVAIAGPGNAVFRHVLQFPALTADAAGQVDATLTSAGRIGWLSPLSRFVIRLGSSAASGGSTLAAEPIAESSVLPLRPSAGEVFAFHAVTSGTSGVSLSQPAGQATITFDAAAQTLTVSVTASGLTPGPHAAHIHLGSCQSQGGVKYMLPDFIADGNGNITGQTRVVTGVTSVPGPGSWYFNLHQGGMNQILANGVPTLSFRPMLCANITTFATTGGSPSPSPSSTMPTSSPSMTTMPSSTPSGSPSPTPTSSPSPSPSSSPSAVPTGQPSHW